MAAAKKAGQATEARRYRLYPEPAVGQRMTAWGHTARAIYNLALEQRQIVWSQWHTGLNFVSQGPFLTQARAEIDWIADFPAQAATQVLRQLDQAYKNWWSPEHPAKAPTFKKRSSSLSFTLPGQAVKVERISRKWGRVYVLKVGWVRFRWSRPLGGQVRNATFSKQAGQWHVSFGVATHRPAPEPNGKPGVGVDFGVACSAFLSDETEPRLMPPSLTDGEVQRLLGLERRRARQLTFAKKHNGGRYSGRLRDTIDQITDLRARQARRRLDFTHKLTTDLAKNHGYVGIEDLKVGNMTRSARGTAQTPGRRVAQKAGLNRSILDNAPGERRRQLEYKAQWYGSELVAVPAPHTSQTCSACGAVDPANRDGCGRDFACIQCGHRDHADRNAAINIFNRASQALGAASGLVGQAGG